MNVVASTKNGDRKNVYAEIEQRYGDLAEGLSRNRETCPHCHDPVMLLLEKAQSLTP
jgi:hypothetical protein